MTSSETNNSKMQALDEALEFTEEIERKIREFNSNSAIIAEKWQKKAENKLKKK